jgi:hypothetical protein
MLVQKHDFRRIFRPQVAQSGANSAAINYYFGWMADCTPQYLRRQIAAWSRLKA